MSNIEKHFELNHAMTDNSQVVSKLELACCGCDVTFPYTQRAEWLQHIKKNHEKLNRSSVVTLGPTTYHQVLLLQRQHPGDREHPPCQGGSQARDIPVQSVS